MGDGGMAIRLVMVNVVVFLALATLRLLVTLGLPLPVPSGAFGLATTSDLPGLAMRPWSAVTHMFAHTEVWHLVMNMLILWWMGGMFRSYFGDRKTLSTYLMGGLAGCVLYVLASNLVPTFPQGGFALGASSAVMALMVATATYTPDSVIRLFLLGPVKLKWVALVYVILDYVALGKNMSAATRPHWRCGYGYVYMRNLPAGQDLGAPIERLIDRLVTVLGSAEGEKRKGASASVGRGYSRCTAVSMSMARPAGRSPMRLMPTRRRDKSALTASSTRFLVGYDQLTKEEGLSLPQRWQRLKMASVAPTREGRLSIWLGFLASVEVLAAHVSYAVSGPGPFRPCWVGFSRVRSRAAGCDCWGVSPSSDGLGRGVCAPCGHFCTAVPPCLGWIRVGTASS